MRNTPHADSVVRRCEDWLKEHFRELDAIARVVERAQLPERTIKRRFKTATGSPLIEYLQNLRIEEAKRMLETGDLPVDEISAEVGYADVSFFRRLLKRLTGLRPNEYRRMFGGGDWGSGGAVALAPGRARRRQTSGSSMGVQVSSE